MTDFTFRSGSKTNFSKFHDPSFVFDYVHVQSSASKNDEGELTSCEMRSGFSSDFTSEVRDTCSLFSLCCPPGKECKNVGACSIDGWRARMCSVSEMRTSKFFYSFTIPWPERAISDTHRDRALGYAAADPRRISERLRFGIVRLDTTSQNGRPLISSMLWSWAIRFHSTP